MPPLPEVIILVLVPSALLFSHRAELHAQLWLLSALLVPGPRTVAPVLRAMGLAMGACTPWNAFSGIHHQHFGHFLSERGSQMRPRPG
jgi:hypothetical protein